MRSFVLKTLAVAAGLSLALSFIFVYYLQRARVFYEQNQKSSGQVLYEQDALLGYRPKPNLSFLVASPPPFWIFTDAEGARVGEGGVDSSRGVDVIATGCSVTFGQRVMQEDSFSGRLGLDLGVKVYNVGISGFSTLSSMLRAQNFLRFRPKVVVYGLIDDHFHRNLSPCTSFWRSSSCRPTVYLQPNRSTGNFERVLPMVREDFRVPEEFVGEHRFGFTDIFWAFRRDWERATGTDASGLNTRAGAGRQSGDQLRAMELVMKEWLRTAEEERYELVVAYIPYPESPQPLAPEKRALFRELEKHPRFHFVDSTEAFRRYLARNPGKSLCASSSDCHPGKEGHALVAEVLYAKLKTLLASRVPTIRAIPKISRSP
jgi:hypothetical protein